MADNLLVDNGAGTDYTAATDDVAGVHYQRVKISLGADGTAVDLNGDTTGGLWAQGAVAHDAVDSGNPLKIGGKANTASPVNVADGDRVDGWFSTVGAQATFLVSSSDAEPNILVLNSAASTDSVAGVTSLMAHGFGMGFNGTSWDRLRTSGTTGFLGVGGSVAHDAVDSGNPVKIGGRAQLTAPTTVADGDRVNAWYGSNGQQMVTLANTSGSILAVGSNPGDNSAGGIAAASNSYGYMYNGSGFDRARTVPSADAQARAGIAAAGLMGFNGTTWDRVATANTGRLQVDVATAPASTSAGDVAHDAVDSGNPVKIGGKVSTVAPAAVAVGDRVNAWFGKSGQLVVTSVTGMGSPTDNAGNLVAGTADPDNQSITASQVFPSAFNGTTWDRMRGDTGGSWVHGGVAHDAVDSGNPLKIGGYASSSLPTVVATGDRANAHLTLGGQQVVTSLTGTSSGVDGVQHATSATLSGAGSSVPYPQALYGYSGTNWDRARTVEGFDTAAANPDLGLLGVGMPDLRFTTLALATAANSTQQWNTNGSNSALVRCGTTTTGTYMFEVTADGTNWRAAEVRNASTDEWASGSSLTPTSGNNFRVLTMGERAVRVRTVTTLGAAVDFVANLTLGVAILPTIKTGPAPHDFGYAAVNLSEQFTAAQTSVAINVAPGNADNVVSSTQKLVITSLQIGVGGTVAATQVTVYFGTGAFSRGTNRVIFDHEYAPSATIKPGSFFSWPVNAPEGAADEELRITTVGAANPLTVTAWGYLVPV